MTADPQAVLQDVGELDLATLKSLLSYDPDDGLFTRVLVTSRMRHVKVGDVAGTIKEGYVLIRVCGKRYRANRLAWFYMTGIWPAFDVDHENGIKTDNRWLNLRDIRHQLNTQNRRAAMRSNKSTGLLGAYRDKKNFRAIITADNKSYDLGHYDTKELAHAAYLEAKRKLHPGGTL